MFEDIREGSKFRYLFSQVDLSVCRSHRPFALSFNPLNEANKRTK